MQNKDYSPLSGQGYFAQALAVRTEQADDSSGGNNAGPSTFRVYYTPPAAANHSRTGGQANDDEDEDSPVVFVCHHGAGYSGMSFALLAKEITEKSNGRAGVLAIDCRAHGLWFDNHNSHPAEAYLLEWLTR